MARVLVTGSADGIGHVTARQLAEHGHTVTLHARDEARATAARARVPAAQAAVVGDLASLAQVRGIAEQANALGRHDAVVHNAGVGYQWPQRRVTEDGLSRSSVLAGRPAAGRLPGSLTRTTSGRCMPVGTRSRCAFGGLSVAGQGDREGARSTTYR